MRFQRILPMTALGLALSAGISGQAHAYAYAYSFLTVTNGTVTVLPPGETALTAFGTCAAVTCAEFTTSPSTASTAEATLGGSGGGTSDNTDAGVATGAGSTFPGGAPTNNTYTLQNPSASDAYSWADSVIDSQQAIDTVTPVNPDGTPDNTSFFETRQIAEGNVTDPTLATSGGGTRSNTELVTNVTVSGDGARVRVDFDAELDMLAEITAPNTGTQATATSNINVSIQECDDDACSSTSAVFSWNAGSASASGVGLAAVSNAFDASQSQSTVTPASVGFSDSGSFFVVTEDLTEGEYRFILSGTVSETVQADASVPAPAPLALLATGLLGVVGSRRLLRRAS